MRPTDAQLLWRGVFITFIAVYSSLLAIQLGHGLASLDAHAIVKVTRGLVNQHQLEVSRPPGHPTTETYLFPAVAWLLRAVFNAEFDERVYLIFQALAGIAAVCVFYLLLRRLEIEQWKATLACVCLGLSPQFFDNAVDGEEFLFAIFFLTVSLYLLVRRHEQPPTLQRLLGSIVCFALATGCRPEVIFAAFIIPLYAALHPAGSWRRMFTSLLGEACAVVIVWLPILFVGLRWPYTAGMNVRESILGGGYRLVFQCFTLPVFVLICWVLFQSVRKWRQRATERFPQNFIFLVSCITPAVFFAALFLHASKPAHVLFALPFLLILAVRRSIGLLVTWTALTLIGCFVTVDIFNERQLVGPHLVPGSYFQTIHEKPFYRLEYLQRAASNCGEAPTAVIADLWPWDFEYHIAHRTFVAREETLPDTSNSPVTAFSVASAASRWNGSPAQTVDQRPMPQCLLLPRVAALQEKVIENVNSRGYAIKMDATLYRTLFARYHITPLAITEGKIGNVAVQLFFPPNGSK